jgi:hypothetical protein
LKWALKVSRRLSRKTDNRYVDRYSSALPNMLEMTEYQLSLMLGGESTLNTTLGSGLIVQDRVLFVAR